MKSWQIMIAVMGAYVIGLHVQYYNIHQHHYVIPKERYGIQTNLPYGNINIYPKL